MAKATIYYKNETEKASIIDTLKKTYPLLEVSKEYQGKSFKRVYVFLENKN